VNVKFCVELGKTFTETLASYGRLVRTEYYESLTPELSVEKFRRTKKGTLVEIKSENHHFLRYSWDYL